MVTPAMQKVSSECFESTQTKTPAAMRHDAAACVYEAMLPFLNHQIPDFFKSIAWLIHLIPDSAITEAMSAVPSGVVKLLADDLSS